MVIPSSAWGDDVRTNNRGFVLACAKDEMGRSPETAAGKPSPTTKGVFKNGVGSAVAGSAIDERLPPSERESCVGMPWHGVALLLQAQTTGSVREPSLFVIRRTQTTS